MKPLFLGVLLIMNLLGYAQERYKISGKLKGIPEGEILLMFPTTEGVKILGQTTLNDGTFLFEGSVEQSGVALIRAAGLQENIPVMLENAEIRISLDENGLSIVGGEAQQLYNQYLDLVLNLAREQRGFQTEFEVAMRMQDQKRMKSIQEECDKCVEKAQKQEISWLRENANHYVAAYVLASNMEQLSHEELMEKFDLLGFNAKASFYGQLIASALASQRSVALGEIAPDFTVNSPDGLPITLHSTKGKAKLISFWSSGNNICRQENIGLLKLYKKYHPKGLEIISVSLDENEQAWKKAIGEDGMIWKNGSELKGAENSEIVRLYFVRTIPHTLLLDENNRIIAKDLPEDKLKRKIEETLTSKQ